MNKILRFSFLTLLMLGFYTKSVQSQVYFSRAAGGWNTAATWSKQLSGTISSGTLTTAVTGVGTNFTTELMNGDVITTVGDVVIGTVSSITNNTNLVLVANAASNNAGITARVRGSVGNNYVPAVASAVTVATAVTAPTGSVSVASLTISAAGSLVIADQDFTVTGATSIANNFTDNNDAGTTTFGGLVSHITGGAWTSTAVTTMGHMVFSNGVTNTLGAFTGGAATFAAGNTITATTAMSFAGDISCPGSLIITGAGLVTNSAGTFDVTNNLTIGTGGLTKSAGDVSVGGNLAMTGPITLTTTGNFYINGTTTHTVGGAFTDNEPTGITTFNGVYSKTVGTFNSTISDQTKIIFNNGFTNVSGAYTGGAATFAAGNTITATIAMSFAGNISCPGSLIITGAGLVTNSAGTFDVTNNLTIGAGGLTKSGGDLTVGGILTTTGPVIVSTIGNFTVNGTSSIGANFTDGENTGTTWFKGGITKSAGTFTSTLVTTASRLKFDGDIANNVGAFTSGSATFYDGITINTAAAFSFNNTPTFSGSATITGAGAVTLNVLSIASGATITRSGTGSITISTDLTIPLTSFFTVSTTSTCLVSGLTVNDGTFTDSDPAAATTFTGLVTNQGTGTFDSHLVNVAGRMIFNGGFRHTAGTFNVNMATFGSGTTLTATSAVAFGGVIVATAAGGMTMTGAGGVTLASGTSTINGPLVANTVITFATVATTLTITGDLSGTGTIDASPGAAAHIINLGGTNVDVGGTITFTCGSSTVNYTLAGAQNVAAWTYNNLTFTNVSSGTKLLSNNATVNAITTVTGAVAGVVFQLNGKTLISLGSISVSSNNATMYVDGNATLKMGSGQTITNAGTFKVKGTLGNIATVTRNTVGNYTISQNTAGAVFYSNYALFDYLGSAGIVLNTNGTLNATDNFSNTTFDHGQGGGGSTYLNLTNLNLGAGTTVTGATFNAGQVYNVTRTAGAGTITFNDAAGVLASGTAGELNDNDLGNPGTLIVWSNTPNTYWSQGTGLFSTLSNWKDGGGFSPSVDKLTDGSSTFIIQNADIITLDTAIDILGLQTTGTSTLTFGNNGTARTATIEGDISVGLGTFWNVGATTATHNLTVKGNFTNDGTVTFQPTSTRLVNLNLDGNGKTIGGSVSPSLSNITFNSAAYSTVAYTATIGLTINGTVTINANATLTGATFTHTVGGNWTQAATGVYTASSSTVIFNGSGAQSIGGAASIAFNNLTINSGIAVSINTILNINGNFLVDNATTVSVTSNLYTQTINGDFTVTGVPSASVYATLATTTFNGGTPQAIDLSNSTFIAITFSGAGLKTVTGTPAATVTGRVTVSNASAVDGNAVFTVSGGLRVDGSGTCAWSGTITLSGGTIDDNIDNALSLGTANIIIAANTTTVNDAITVGGNFTVSAGTFTLTAGSSILGTANVFTINAAAAMTCQDLNNFPTGFASYALATTSTVTYNTAATQTIKGRISYGNLVMAIAGTKTASDSLDIKGNLTLTNAVILDLNGYSHTLAGNVANATGSIVNPLGTGTFTLNAADANQTIAVTTGSYTFNNFSIWQSAPTLAHTKTFSNSINLTGAFYGTNPNGDDVILLTISLGTFNIIGNSTGKAFTLDANVILTSTVANLGATTFGTFASPSLNVASTINYNGAAQVIATGFSYGNLTISGTLNKTPAIALDVNGTMTASGTAVFIDMGLNHTVAGNWAVPAGNFDPTNTGTITLDGVAQTLSASRFYNLVSAGTGTKTQNGNITIMHNFTINDNSTYTAHNVNILIAGDWSQAALGVFMQNNNVTTNGFTIFNGTLADQILTCLNGTSYFGNVIINKPTAFRTLTLNSTCTIAGVLDVWGPGTPGANAYSLGFAVALDGALNFSNQSLYVGDNFLVRTGAGLTSLLSTLYLNGSNAQVIWVNCTACSLNNISFSNAGQKTFTQATGSVVDINGNVDIVGSTVNTNANSINLTVAGNWSNTGVFAGDNRTVTFDGGNQNIGQSQFGGVVIAGTLTKTLTGGITLTNGLVINNNATLDAGLLNNSITLGGLWDNSAVNGVFIPQQGSVSFTGAASAVYTGSIGVPGVGTADFSLLTGKSFYNVFVTKTAGVALTLGGASNGDLNVTNNLTITTGTLNTGAYDVLVGGVFSNASTYTAGTANSSLTLNNQTNATLNFDPGTTHTIQDFRINATAGTVYTAQNNFTVTTVNAATTGMYVTSGTFDLNGKNLTFAPNNINRNVLTTNGGTFNIGPGGFLYMANQNIILNSGGTFKAVGSAAFPATITRATGATGYIINQTSGEFNALYYDFEFLNWNTTVGCAACATGIKISSGTINGTNNFSNGTFANGFAGSTQYLDLSGCATTTTASSVVFNTGPGKNVKSTGAGTITLADATGTLNGAANEWDDGFPNSGFVQWTNHGIYWTGGAFDGLWSSAGNWSSNSIPGPTDTVTLDHHVPGGIPVGTPYTVTLDNAASNTIYRLNIDKGTGLAIGLVLNTLNTTLTVTENVSVYTGCTLTSTLPSNTISVGGNLTISGTFNANSSTIILNPAVGSKTVIVPAGAPGTFNNLTINGTSGTTINLGSAIIANGDVSISGTTLDVTAANYGITVGGNWNLGTGGLLNSRAGTVTFNKTGPSTQTINAGTFFNFVTSALAATATKQITGSISIDGSLTIGANCVVDGGATTISIGTNFSNNASLTGFSQTGIGAVIFNGGPLSTNAQAIDNGAFATTFNNLTLQGSGTKTWTRSSTINGNFLISSGVTTVNMQTAAITGAGVNDFTISAAATLQLRSTNNFPAGFETMSISSSTVQYLFDGDQTIYSVPSPGYGTLTVGRAGAGLGPYHKTAAGNLIVLGTLTINDIYSDLVMGTNNITLTGNLGVAGATYVGDPVTWTTGGIGTMTHVGAGWNIDSDIKKFNNLALSEVTGNTVTMFNNLTIEGSVTVNNNSTLTMGAFTMVSTQAGKTFILNPGSRINCAIPSPGLAFPTGFASYSLDATSLTFLNSVAAVNQIVKTSNSILYGNLQFSNVIKTVTAEAGAALSVAGYFYQSTSLINTPSLNFATFDDNGQNLNFGGDVWFANYTPSSNSRTITFNGTSTQSIRNYYGNVYPAPLILPITVFSGTGAKTLGDGTDLVTINGTLTINTNAPVTSATNITFNGSAWANNGGAWSHTAGTLTFNNAGVVTITPGVTNAFFNVDFTGGGTFTFGTNNVDFNGATFNITSGIVNMGGLTHTIAATTVTNLGTWNTATTNLTFDGVAQSIPTLTAQDIVIGNAGTKTLAGAWNIRNLTINSGTILNTSAASNYAINLTGDWSNAGTFTPNAGTVTFNGSASPRTIDNNASGFYTCDFSPSLATTYNLTGTSTTISLATTISTNATLNLNGKILIVGSGAAVAKTITVNGILNVGSGSVLRLFNAAAPNIVTMNVYSGGTLKIVGTPSSIATVTQQTTRGHQINVLSGAYIEARYYLIEYLSDFGMDVQAGSILHATNNFSDGTWSNIRTVGGGVRTYLVLNCTAPAVPGDSIANTLFNCSVAPVVNTYFNVQRSSGAGSVITFKTALGGALGDKAYENDGLPVSATLGTLHWPPITSATWLGTISSDWHNKDNWSSGEVPTTSVSAIIPSAPNSCIVSTADANCKGVSITTGQLTLQGGFDLNSQGDIYIGNGGAGVLAIASATSDITCAGNWTRGATGVFTHGGATVNFTGSTGASTISPLTSNFNNVTFNNASAVFYLTGATINVLGNFTVLAGQLYPNTVAYTYNIGGDFVCTGSTGTFGTLTAGTVVLNGSTQSITDATFSALTISGTAGAKTTSGTTTIAGNLIVNSPSTFGAASGVGNTIDMNGTVTLNIGSTFSDGGNTHTFSGTTWTGLGSYTGTGTIVCDKPGGATQTIAGGSFSSLRFDNGNAVISITGNITNTGDLYIANTINGVTIANGLTFINSSGTGAMTLEAAETITCSGTNSFPAGFASYDLVATSTVTYNGASDQNIYGVNYGNLTLTNANNKSLLNDIAVKNTLTFGAATLDVTASNFSVNIQGAWNNNTTGVFIPRNADVIFDGTVASQTITIAVGATNPFYNLKVNKSAQFLYQSRDITITNDLTVTSGIHYSGSGGGTPYITYVGKNLSATSGTFSNIGTYYMNNVGGSPTIQVNGSSINHLTLNGAGTTFLCVGTLTVLGDFNLLAGTFDGNSNTVNLGDNGDGVTINGTYKIGASGVMAIGNSVTTTVNGAIEVIGTPGNIATITRNIIGGAGSFYGTFNVASGGTINAKYYLMEYMGLGGILVSNGATINTTNNFSEGTFNNGRPNGVYLNIENNQRFTATTNGSITNISFSMNPGGTAKNVKKTTTPSDTLEFYNATGIFAGATYESDGGNYINWTGPITLTWDGSSSTNWYDATNWTASSGPNIVPTGAENVVIANVSNKPIIDTAGAKAANLTIALNSSLTITSVGTPTTPASALTDLIVSGDITINGTLTMSSVNDGMFVGGNWTKPGSGTVTISNGTVNFNSSASKSINNGMGAFGYVIFSGSSTYTLGAAIVISKDLTISSGTLDVSATAFQVSVGGNFINNGTFIARTGKLVLNASSGTKTFNPGTSVFSLIDFNCGGAAYNLTTNNLSTTGNVAIVAGTFNLNGLTFNLGDGVGGDFLSITGTLLVNTGAFLKMSASSSLTVNSGGTFSIIGTSIAVPATITRQSAGTYGFTVSSGGHISAKYYLMEYMNATGIYLNSGALMDTANFFRSGTFSNGAAGGRFLKFENDFPYLVTDTIRDVVFNSGSTYNCTRNTGIGTGTITFKDPSGTKGNFIYEEDNVAASATTGLINWAYSSPTVTWVGGSGTDYNDALNWNPVSIPAATINVIIPDVSVGAGGSGNFPLINNVSFASNGAALAKNLTILTGGRLTLSNDRGLTITNDFSNGGTLDVTGSSSVISVGGSWADAGTSVIPGSSTVVLTAASGSKSIMSAAANNFYNLTISGNAIFTLGSSIRANNNITISSGTLDVSASGPGYGITLAGNWSNSATFTKRSGTVTFNGVMATNPTQTITSGTGAGRAFYNIAKAVASTSNIALASSIDVANDLTISKGNLNGGANTIMIAGDFNWTNTTGTVSNTSLNFYGTVSKNFTYSNGTPTFTDVTINKTVAGNILSLVNSMTLSGTLTLTKGIVQTASGKILKIASGGITTIGSTTCYVDGTMAYDVAATGATTINFPIGKSTSYRPVVLNVIHSSAASATYTAELFNTSANSLGYSLPATLLRVSYMRYWQIDRSATANFTSATVRLYYSTAPTDDGVTNFDSLAVAKTIGAGTAWNDIGGTATANGTGNVLSGSFTSFSRFTLANKKHGTNPLPIELLKFDAKQNNNEVDLSWTTATETNNDFFTVERSQNAVDFEKVAEVDGAGNSTSILNYTSVDLTPLKGTSYYRLKQTDFDGKFMYSNLVDVEFKINPEFSFDIYPNPSGGASINLAIKGEKAEEVLVVVYDALGSEGYSKVIILGENGDNVYAIDLSNKLAKGIYYITATSNQKLYRKKLIIE